MPTKLIKKCISPCRGAILEKCKQPFCNYINKTRKYCTLNRKRYLLKKDERGCNIYPKAVKSKKKGAILISKSIKAKLIEKLNQAKERVLSKKLRAIGKKHAKKTIKKRVAPVVKVSRISMPIKAKLVKKLNQAKERVLSRKLQTLRKKHAEKTIKKFMLDPTVREKSTAIFLHSICSDSGVCIAFGQEAMKIKKFFNNFTDFNYLKGNIERIGKPSKNGFLYELTYMRQGYNAYAILKSTMRYDRDNLMYEYFVGNAVNTFAKQVPCFVETYGLFEYPSDADWKVLKTASPDKENVIKNKLTLIPAPNFSNLDKGCSKSKYQCILIQHLKDVTDLGTILRKNKNDFANKELISVLYIIYFSLHVLSDRFTHYDLHLGNVLLYTPSKNGYINYVFHEQRSERVVKFKSRFIPKIIDYGRCFYSLDVNNNSGKLYDKLCTLPECNPKCGDNQGFNWLSGNNLHYINSRAKNESHDLILLNNIKSGVIRPSYKATKPIKQLFTRVVYTREFGTEENVNSGLPTKINNISDAFTALSDMVFTEQPALSDGLFPAVEYASLGELHVYSDGRPMRFIKA